MTRWVLLAGMNCSEDLWSGCGVDDALTPPLDRESVDEQVGHLLRTLPPRFLLGGSSLGAVVATALALRAPERVAGLLLTATNARAPTDGQRRGWGEWRRRLDAGVPPRVLQEEILPLLLAPSTAVARPDLVERTLAMADAVGAAVLRRQLALQDSRQDLLGRLPTLTVPVRVVSGIHDALCPPEFHTAIAAAVPGAELTTTATGHLGPLEDPRAFAALLHQAGPGSTPR
ncbi:alpha/beta hydrolase [Kineococcus sp. NBC_00420]|uniref:alpha/beta fold hydrolase n=1 Tax=Kineococcus sp. NBC_00420 TaxID=2903564 RepID=UPI002E2512E9